MASAALASARDVLQGADKCRAFADGSQERSCFVWWTWFAFLVLVTFSAIAGHVVRIPHAVRRKRLSVLLTNLVIQVLGLGLAVYIMYYHCTRCNGLVGFGVTLLILLAAGIFSMLTMALLAATRQAEQAGRRVL